MIIGLFPLLHSFFQFAPTAGHRSQNLANGTATSMIQKGPGMTLRRGARQSTLTGWPRSPPSYLRRKTILCSHWCLIFHGSAALTRLWRASGGGLFKHARMRYTWSIKKDGKFGSAQADKSLKNNNYRHMYLVAIRWYQSSGDTLGTSAKVSHCTYRVEEKTLLSSVTLSWWVLHRQP